MNHSDRPSSSLLCFSNVWRDRFRLPACTCILKHEALDTLGTSRSIQSHICNFDPLGSRIELFPVATLLTKRNNKDQISTSVDLEHQQQGKCHRLTSILNAMSSGCIKGTKNPRSPVDTFILTARQGTGVRTGNKRQEKNKLVVGGYDAEERRHAIED